jgi:CRP-like cAMP-binding protein
MTTLLDAAAVRAVPCLALLTEDEAAAGARQLQARRLGPGEVLFREGDPGDSVYVLVRGEVEVRVAGLGGDHDLATLRSGTLLGEFALLADARRFRSVVAITEAELWELTRDRFEAALNAGEIWATRFLQAAGRELARRLMSVDQELVALMEEGRSQPQPVARVRELEKLRRKLSGEWTF